MLEPEQVHRHQENVMSSEFWPADLPHVIEKDLYIQHATIRVEAGSVIRFREGASLNIMESGGLIADGTSKNILFTRMDEQSGNWKYIFFAKNAVSDSCRLIRCRFEYGGNDALWPAMIYCQQSSPTLQDCEITQSASAGIYFAGDCSTLYFSNNTITLNSQEPILTAARNVPQLTPGNYTGNGDDFIKIVDGDITEDATWPHLGLSYRIADALRISGATLSLPEGSALYFAPGQGLTVTEQGGLRADGRNLPILFTGERPIKGSWKGLHFKDCSMCNLVNCSIEYGGSDISSPANLYLENTSPWISDCRIQRSGHYGIVVRGTFEPNVFINNLVTENGGAAASVHPKHVPELSGNSFTRNGRDFIDIEGGLIDESDNWPDLGIDYFIKDKIMVRSATLYLSPGTNLSMGDRGSIDIMEGGGLIADGASGIITFTGAVDFPGSWHCIYFSSTSNDLLCYLNHCLIQYGGGESSRPANIYCADASPKISNCTISASLGYGIYLEGNSQPILQDNIFSGNLSGPQFP